MRIASISDLHVDHAANRGALAKLAAEVRRRGADLLIVAGDVSHDDQQIEETLRSLGEAAPRVAYLPGNHDLWSPVPEPRAREDVDTWERYRDHLRRIAERAGAHYVPARPLLLGPVALVGTCGWYDYSFVEDWVRAELGDAALAEKKLGPMSWLDGVMTAFRGPDRALVDDATVARQMEAELSAQLAEVEARAEIEHVVVATHHQPFREVVFRTGTLPWEYFCAFMGSVGLGDVIRSGRKVRAAVYGHSHIVGDQMIGGLRVFGTALGYPRERGDMDDAALLATRIGWIELTTS